MSCLNLIHSPALRVLSVVFFVGCGPGEAPPDANSGSSSTMGGSAGVETAAGDSTDEGDPGSTGGQSTGAGNGSDDVGSSGRATTHAEGSSTSAGATTAGPGTTGSGTDDSGTGVGVAAGEIVCGDAVCDGPTEYCLACEHGDSLDVHCEPQIGDPWQQAFDDGCSSFPLFLDCDTPDDCDGGSVCRFSGGEAGTATCFPEQGNPPFGSACDDAHPCSRGWTCEFVDPLGYFGPYETALGWLPRACVAP